MIYDCFTFYSELDILEIRLHILDKVVDKFVIIEANETFSGMKKDYIFEKNRTRFQEFLHKIIYIPIVFPEFENKTPEETRWARENYQRNQIPLGLKNAFDEDIVLISDVDEIPEPKSIKKYQHKPGIKALDMYMFCFYLNYLSKYHIWTHSSKMLSYRDFLSILDKEDFCYGVVVQKDINIGTTPTKIRLYEGKHQVHYFPCGWHFSYMGGKESIIKKLDSFAHQEWREKSPDSITEAQRMLNEKRLFGYELGYIDLQILDKKSGLIPQYIIEKSQKYPQLILSGGGGVLMSNPKSIIWISQWIFIRRKILKSILRFLPKFLKQGLKIFYKKIKGLD